MRFYQLETVWKDGDAGETYSRYTWHGTEQEAVRLRSALFTAGKLVGLKREQRIDPVDIPTSKAELLAFLKINVTTEVII